ncbi:hypothetical protein K3G63_03325 [Hymenobacter sp. HSC-4F20]|uniref:hypothetical protein n=1 Tax=Hymenobacter sp. HSC-4F20 TaxID=2864135 RepID=UPI001C738636|nr:hypothetical protein [Hymenobacter sp. HSC-4F20]MBX0289450.1 hypothetical protein [Hymenobacter sp. HSC-4F20]
MPRLLRLLLLSLTLLAAACQKDNSEPKPSIEGRWTLKRLVTYMYDANGKLLTQTTDSTSTALTFYTVISKDSIRHYSVTDNFPLGGSKLTYLNANSFTYDQGTVVIKELTAHTLVLRYIPERKIAGQPYFEGDDVYSR